MAFYLNAMIEFYSVSFANGFAFIGNQTVNLRRLWKNMNLE